MSILSEKYERIDKETLDSAAISDITDGALTFDWNSIVYENALTEAAEIEEFIELIKKDSTLIGYYKDMLKNKPEHKEYFDLELRSRHLEYFMAPDKEDLARYYTNLDNINMALVIDVIQAKSIDALISRLNDYYGHTTNVLLCVALFIAICINKNKLASEIQLHITKADTYSDLTYEFLNKIATESAVTKVQSLYNRYQTAVENIKAKKVREEIKIVEAASKNRTDWQKQLATKWPRTATMIREDIQTLQDPELLECYKKVLESCIGYKEFFDAELERRGFKDFIC